MTWAGFLVWWSNIDPILKGAASLVVVGGAIPAVIKFVRLLRVKLQSAPTVFEVKPIGFMVNLPQQIPHVEVHFYAINYLSRPLTLSQVNVSSLQIGGTPSLDRIPLVHDDINLPARSSRIVICRRQLTPHEIAALPSPQWRENGSISLTAKARYKQREYRYGPVSSLATDGWILRGEPSPKHQG